MYKVKNYFRYFLPVIIFSYSCNQQKQTEDTSEFKSVRVLMKVVLRSQDSTNELLSDSTDICYYKDFTVYKKSLENTTTGFYYLVKYKDDSVAYKIDSLQQERPTFKKQVLDSAYKERLSTNFANINEKIQSQYVLNDSVQLNSKDVKYSYRVKEKIDATYGDSVYYFYTSDSKLAAGSNFSLSKNLDNSNRGKLFKAAIIFNENPDGTNAFEKLGKLIEYELKSIQVLNKKEIMDFIDHYKKPD